MKKLGLTVVAASVLAGGIYINQTSKGGDTMLDHVPADTVFFAAQVTPFPVRAQLEQYHAPMLSEQDMAMLKQEMEAMTEPAPRFLAAWFLHYAEAQSNPDTFINDYGLAEEVTGYVYTLGVIPVIKSSLAYPDKLFATLDRLEQQSGQGHELRTVGDRQARVYPLVMDDSGGTVEVWLSHHDGELTATLGAPFLTPEQVELALGVTRPRQSLADSQELQQLKLRNGFSGDNLGFLNHQRLVTGLMSQNGNTMARQLTSLIDNPSSYGALRNEVCHREWSAIAANWPRTAFESNHSLVDGKLTMAGQVVLESHNGVVMEALNNMRGFLPRFGESVEMPLLSVALGLNGDTLQQSLTSIRNQWLEQPYECESLGEIQDELKLVPPETLGLFAGFTDGVQGMSFNLFDYQLNGQQSDAQMLQSMDMLTSFSAKDPGKIVATLASTYPPLAGLNVQSGEKRQLTDFMGYPLPQAMTAQVAGEHLMIYSGAQGEAAAEALGGQPASPNGLFSLTLDYARSVAPLMEIIRVVDPEAAAQMEAYNNMDARMSFKLDADSRGVVMDYSQVAND